MQQPLVSILIPAYNAAGTIAEAMESCLKQTYSNCEIIVCDDGSADETVNIIKAYEKVRVLRNESNEGTASARNRLLQAAQGTYIAWLDADDTMTPDRLELQADYLEKHPEVDILGTWFTTDDVNMPIRKFPVDNATITAYLWWKNCLAQPTVMSRNFYASENLWYDVQFAVMQDYELWLRLRNRKIFANLPLPLTCYHVSTGSEIRNKHEKYSDRALQGKLWALKWSERGMGLSEAQKTLFERFISTETTFQREEISILRSVFSTMAKDLKIDGSDTDRLIIHFFRLILWKRLSLLNRIFNSVLLMSLLYVRRLKRLYLMQ